MKNEIKKQRRAIYSEIDRLHVLADRGEDVAEKLLDAGRRLDELGKNKPRVDVMDVSKVKTAAEKEIEIENKLAEKLKREERKKWREIAEKNGIRHKTFLLRISRGKSYEEAAMVPKGHYQLRNPWRTVAEKNSITESTFNSRRYKGWTDEEAATIPLGTRHKKHIQLRESGVDGNKSERIV